MSRSQVTLEIDEIRVAGPNREFMAFSESEVRAILSHLIESRGPPKAIDKGFESDTVLSRSKTRGVSEVRGTIEALVAHAVYEAISAGGP